MPRNGQMDVAIEVVLHRYANMSVKHDVLDASSSVCSLLKKFSYIRQ
jgi:hypothetical protein